MNEIIFLVEPEEVVASGVHLLSAEEIEQERKERQ